MDKTFGSARLFSLRHVQDVSITTGGKGQQVISQDTALALGHELHSAVRWGDVESTLRLLQAGADPNTATEDLGATPIHIAAMLGRTIWSNEPVYGVDVAVRLVRELLQGGADVDALDKYGFTALHLAAATGAVVLVSLLLRSSANPSVQDSELLFTPLHVAISNGNMDAALLLIEAGVDTARTDYTGRSAWQVFQKTPAAATATMAAAAAANADAGGAARGEGGSGGGAIGLQPVGPQSMLQLLLTGLREGKAVPVSAVFNLVLEITGSAGDNTGGKAGAASSPASGADADGGGAVGAMVRQLVVTIRDLGDLAGCWQLLAEAVRGGAAAVAALVVSAVVGLHPASLEETPWGGVLVDLMACLPSVFDQLVAELRLAPPEYLSAAVRRLHPSRLDPSTRLLLYRRLVAALQHQVQSGDGGGRGGGGGSGGGGGGDQDKDGHKGSDGGPDRDGGHTVVARTFLQELPPDTVADLASTPFFQDFTQLLPALTSSGHPAGGTAGGGPGPGGDKGGHRLHDARAAAEDQGASPAAATPGVPAAPASHAAASVPAGAAGAGMRGLMLQSSAGGPLDCFVVTNLLKGAMQSGSLLAVDYVVQSVLSWQRAANAAGRRALLLGLHSELLDGLATSFPTSCRALMQMPRQRGPLMHVQLPRAATRRDGQQLFRCSPSSLHHLVWWPRLTRTLTTGPGAAGDLRQVESLLVAGLPLESLHVIVTDGDRRRRQRRRRSSNGGGGGYGSDAGQGEGGMGHGGAVAAEPGKAPAEAAGGVGMGVDVIAGKAAGSWRSRGNNVVVPVRDDDTQGGRMSAGKAAMDAGGDGGGTGGSLHGKAAAATAAATASDEVVAISAAATANQVAGPSAEAAEGAVVEAAAEARDKGGAGGRRVPGCGVAAMVDLISRGLKAEQINSLVCSGTSLAGVVAALDAGVPRHLIAGLLDAGLCFQILEALLHRSVHQSTRYWKLRPHNELFFRLPFATWHNGLGYPFFGPFLTEWEAAGWARGFIDRIFHANDPLAARLKAAYDHRGVPQRLPGPLMAAHDPRLAATAQRRLLLLRVFLAGWWLPQRWATAALLAAAWAVELGTRWAVELGTRLAALRGPAGLRTEQLVPHDAVAEVLPVYGITRVGRAGLLRALTRAGVPSDWYGLELPRAVVLVHWEGYARALFAMQGLEHMLIMALNGVFLWSLRGALDDEEERLQQLSYLSSSTPKDNSSNHTTWTLRSARLAVPLLLLSCSAAAGLVLEFLRARANGFAAYRSHQANWLRATTSSLTLAIMAVLLAGGSASQDDDGGGGSGDGVTGSAWWRSMQVALALGSVQVLLLCYQLLLFSSLSDGMGGLVRMVVEVVRSMGYFFLMLAIVFGGFTAAFAVLKTASLDLTAFTLRLFTVMLGDFANDELYDMLSDGTFLVPALGVVLMAAYGVVLIIVLVNLLIAIMTDAYAKVRSSEGAEVARNQAYIINDIQMGLPAGLVERLDTALLGPYLHVLTVTAAESAAAAAGAGVGPPPGHRRGVRAFRAW